jgi:hypothetical protein
MFFKSIFTLGLMASVAVCAPVESTQSVDSSTLDLPQITASFNRIESSIDQLVYQLNSWNPSISPNAIIGTNGNLINELRNAADQINRGPALGLTEAVGVLTPVQGLATKVDTIIRALQSKQNEINQVQLGRTVKEELIKDRRATGELIDAIFAKLPLPAVTKPIAQPLAKQITDKLEDAISHFG